MSPITGNIFLAGTFKYSININGATTFPVGNPQNTFLVSLDSNYNFNWMRHGGGDVTLR